MMGLFLMHMDLWLLAAIASPFCWAFTNVVDSTLRKNHIKSDWALVWFLAVIRLPIALMVLPWVGIEIFLNWDLNTFFMLIAGFFWTAPLLAYFKAMETEDASVVALLVQMTPVFTLIIASLFIGEVLSKVQLLAFVLIFLGGIVATLKGSIKDLRLSKVFWIMMIAGMMWAASDVAFKAFEKGFSSFIGAMAIYYIGGAAICVFPIFMKRAKQKVFAHFKGLSVKMWALLIVNDLIGVLGSVSFAYALTLGEASLTAVMLGTQPIFAFLFGLILCRHFPGIAKESLDQRSVVLKVFAMLLVLSGLFYLNMY